MNPALSPLAERYRTERPAAEPVETGIRRLYDAALTDRGKTVLDTVATCIGLSDIVTPDGFDSSRLNPQMEEAFALTFPNKELGDLAEMTPDALGGLLNNWKGKYFEVLVRDRLNAGEWVGDIHLDPGQTAELAKSLTQTGWDLQILNDDGTVADALQLKATDSLAYVREALERYPTVDIIATDDVSVNLEELSDRIFKSGLSDPDLEQSLGDAVADSPGLDMDDLTDYLLPVLPFVLIATTEMIPVLMGRKTFELALEHAASRSVKTGTAMGAGAVTFWLVDSTAVSLVVAVTVRLAMGRYATLKRAAERLDAHTTALAPLHAQYATDN